jgi:hypothetical protein
MKHNYIIMFMLSNYPLGRISHSYVINYSIVKFYHRKLRHNSYTTLKSACIEICKYYEIERILYDVRADKMSGLIITFNLIWELFVYVWFNYVCNVVCIATSTNWRNIMHVFCIDLNSNINVLGVIITLDIIHVWSQYLLDRFFDNH